MNQIEDRVHDFLKIKHSLNSYLSDCIQDAEKKEDLYEMCQRAALYRVYSVSYTHLDVYKRQIFYCL